MRFATRGVSQTNVNTSNLRKVLIPLPPIAYQHTVVERIERLRCARRSHQRRANQARRLAAQARERLLGDDTMTFNEANTVEAFIRDRLCGGITHHTAVGPGLARRHGQISGLGWHFLAPQNLPRQPHEVLVEDHLREALIRLNPEIAAQPDRADDVLYKLRAIIMGVRSDGLVKANEEFAAWLTGERSMPFGENGEHVTIRLIDFADLEQNQYVVTTQYTVPRRGHREAGRPRAARQRHPAGRDRGEDAVRASQSWLDGALQVHDDYERNVPELFVPNVFSVATEGKEFRYGSIGLPVELWGPWRIEADTKTPALQQIEKAVASMLRPHVVLDLLANFTAYATDKKKRRIKIIARYQQYDGANKIVERVVAGHPKKGLIWHFQGSGKSLLMLFAARKLRLHPALKNPTVMIVVDRIDLDTQISEHLLRRRHAEPGEGRQPRRAAAAAGAGRAQDHHHDDLQVRRGRRRPQRPQQHHRHGRRGPPHAGRRPRPQDARGAAQRVPVRPDRHADQPRRPQHLLRLRRRRGRARLHEPLRLRGVDPRRRHDAAALRAAPARAAHRQGGDRRGLQGADRRPERPRQGPARQDRREDGRAGEVAGAHPEDLRGHRPALPGEGRARTASGRRSSPSTARAACSTRRRSTSTCRRRSPTSS